LVALCERSGKHASPEDDGEHTDHDRSCKPWTEHQYGTADNNSSVDGADHKAMTNWSRSFFLSPPLRQGFSLIIRGVRCDSVDDSGPKTGAARQLTPGLPG
jgi:hypothetical protein